MLAIYRDERVVEESARKGRLIARAMEALATRPGVLRTRALGMIGAADLAGHPGAGYLGTTGRRVCEEARRRGAYLRPLGDTVYVCPPLTIDDADLDALLAILEESVRVVIG